MRIIIVLMFFLLGACAPTSYVYVKKFTQQRPQIDKVLIMVEYLDIKQSFGMLWKFAEDSNLQQQDTLYNFAEQALKTKGYLVSTASLKTSGLIIDRNFPVNHYVNNKKMPQTIVPPYIVRSLNIDDESIRGLEYLLAELNQPMSNVMSDLRGYVTNNYQKQMVNIDVPDNTGILIIQSYKPKFYPFAIMDINISSSSGSGAAVGFGSTQQSSITYAYLLHKGSGDLLWSNKTSLIKTRNQEKFFLALPENPQQYDSK